MRFNGSYKSVQQVLCQLGGRGGGEAVGGECRHPAVTWQQCQAVWREDGANRSARRLNLIKYICKSGASVGHHNLRVHSRIYSRSILVFLKIVLRTRTRPYAAEAYRAISITYSLLLEEHHEVAVIQHRHREVCQELPGRNLKFTELTHNFQVQPAV